MLLATRRRIRRPSSISNQTSETLESAATSEVKTTRLTSSTRTNLTPVKKIAQDRSDQQLEPSSNRFRLRTKQRGNAAVAAATSTILTGGGAAATSLALTKKDKKDKDGYKVCTK